MNLIILTSEGSRGGYKVVISIRNFLVTPSKLKSIQRESFPGLSETFGQT